MAKGKKIAGLPSRSFWALIICGGVVLLIIIGSVGGSDSGSDSASSGDQAAATQNESKPKSKNQRLKAALADATPPGAGEVTVDKIDYGRSLNITLKTPEGGLEGASVNDLNNSMAATAEAVYGVAKYPATKELVVAFRGGLVDTDTGKDLPNVNTAIYTLPYSKARQIDWADEDTVYYTINWSNYNDFTHPAIKSD